MLNHTEKHHCSGIMYQKIEVLLTMLLLLMSCVEQYHRAVLLVKNNQNNVKKESVATALLGNRTRDFWKEVGKVTKKNTLCKITTQVQCRLK